MRAMRGRVEVVVRVESQSRMRWIGGGIVGRGRGGVVVVVEEGRGGDVGVVFEGEERRMRVSVSDLLLADIDALPIWSESRD